MDTLVKERSTNFTADEIERLKVLIDKHKDILMCKKTDAVSYNSKELAWNRIHSAFNANTTLHRSIKQLKYKFDNLKKTARKDASKERQERRRTGGGRPDIPPTSSTGDWMRSIISMSTDGLKPQYDDDVIECTQEEPIALVKDDFIVEESSQTVITSTSPTAEVEITHNLQDTELNIEKNEISDSTAILPVFDSGAPALLLRCPVSTPLKRPRDRSTVTPQALRKSFKDLNQKRLCLADKKQTILDQADSREEQEFNLKIKHKEEMHIQALRHNEERHNAEMHILTLKGKLLELDIQKLNT